MPCVANINQDNRRFLRLSSVARSPKMHCIALVYIPVVKNADAFRCMLLVVVVWNRVQRLLGDQAGSEKE